ncbi:MAG: SpoIIE family protein phosphatase [Planctomycetes bacterium]|nr:SpoIIE family protein phosphatase [Planctomycetota bacterium]
MKSTGIRWWDTLFFRGAMVVNVLMAIVFVAYAFIEYRTERQRAVATLHARLTEETLILRAARVQFSALDEFERFVNSYCHQMGPAASPGHHIIVVDEKDNIVIRAHERQGDALETGMVAQRNKTQPIFEADDEPFLAASADLADGCRLVIAQSLTKLRSTLAATRNRTVAITSVLVLVVFACSTLAFRWWVRRPLADLCNSVAALGARDFTARAPVSGTGEIRFLAESVNQMADRLSTFDRAQQSAMQRARDIQRSLLPKHLPDLDTLNFAQFFQPAESIGGDLFDVLQLDDNRIMVAMFDVSGHGTPAALNTALLRTVFRQCARVGLDTMKIIHELNRELVEIGDAGEFATCLLLSIDPSDGRFSVISAGHDPPMILRQKGKTERMGMGGLPLGVEKTSQYKILHATLNTGDRLFLFTDGIHEVFDDDGEIFGRDGLQLAIESTASEPLQDQVRTIVDRLIAFQGSASFTDDLTLFAIERN